MPKNKVIHARIDEDIHDQLLEKCNELGCNLSDYFVSVLTESLDNNSESVEEPTKEVDQYPKYDLNLNYGKVTDIDGNLIGYLKGFTQEESEAKIAQNKHENREIPTVKNAKISYDDGKTWIDLKTKPPIKTVTI